MTTFHNMPKHSFLLTMQKIFNDLKRINLTRSNTSPITMLPITSELIEKHFQYRADQQDEFLDLAFDCGLSPLRDQHTTGLWLYPSIYDYLPQGTLLTEECLDNHITTNLKQHEAIMTPAFENKSKRARTETEINGDSKIQRTEIGSEDKPNTFNALQFQIDSGELPSHIEVKTAFDTNFHNGNRSPFKHNHSNFLLNSSETIGHTDDDNNTLKISSDKLQICDNYESGDFEVDNYSQYLKAPKIIRKLQTYIKEYPAASVDGELVVKKEHINSLGYNGRESFRASLFKHGLCSRNLSASPSLYIYPAYYKCLKSDGDSKRTNFTTWLNEVSRTCRTKEDISALNKKLSIKHGGNMENNSRKSTCSNEKNTDKKLSSDLNAYNKKTFIKKIDGFKVNKALTHSHEDLWNEGKLTITMKELEDSLGYPSSELSKFKLHLGKHGMMHQVAPSHINCIYIYPAYYNGLHHNTARTAAHFERWIRACHTSIKTQSDIMLLNHKMLIKHAAEEQKLKKAPKNKSISNTETQKVSVDDEEDSSDSFHNYADDFLEFSDILGDPDNIELFGCLDHLYDSSDTTATETSDNDEHSAVTNTSENSTDSTATVQSQQHAEIESTHTNIIRLSLELNFYLSSMLIETQYKAENPRNYDQLIENISVTLKLQTTLQSILDSSTPRTETQGDNDFKQLSESLHNFFITTQRQTLALNAKLVITSFHENKHALYQPQHFLSHGAKIQAKIIKEQTQRLIEEISVLHGINVSSLW